MALRRSARIASAASIVEDHRGENLEPCSQRTTKKKTSSETKVAPSRPLRKVPSRDLEIELWNMGFVNVVGVDEAGRGPLAGPVVAAACMIPKDVVIEGIDDSKKLTADKREQLYDVIASTPGVLFSACIVDASTIDEINILQATMQAMVGCVEKLNLADASSYYILVDGNRVPEGRGQWPVQGDSECHVIAAASIVAKVTRDRLMLDYDERWPVYGFKDHKGYGTAAHTAALLKYGPCEIHRRSFAPLKDQVAVERAPEADKATQIKTRSRSRAQQK